LAEGVDGLAKGLRGWLKGWLKRVTGLAVGLQDWLIACGVEELAGGLAEGLRAAKMRSQIRGPIVAQTKIDHKVGNKMAHV